MNIIFFMEDYYLGGLDTFVINLVNSWPDNCDQLTLICNRKHTGLSLIEESITRPCKIIKHNILIFSGFFELTEKNGKFINFLKIILKLASPSLKYLFLFYNVLMLKKILTRDRPDRLFIINGGYPGGDSCRAASIAWGLFSNKPHSIHNFHGIALRAGWHIRIQEFLVDMLVARFTKAFITVSQAAADTMLSRGSIYKKNKTSFIYNGITLPKEKDCSKTIRDELGISNRDPLCLMFGSYHRNKNFNKGHYFLLQVFKKVVDRIPSAHLLACGFGSEKSVDDARKLVLKFGLEKKVFLSGFRRNISSLLTQADAILISSQTFESFCLVAIEAMAHRVPVVATRVGAIPEVVINNQGGYCVDKEDVASFADYTIKLLENKELKKEQGEKGFRRYKEFFTAGLMAGRYYNLLHNE